MEGQANTRTSIQDNIEQTSDDLDRSAMFGANQSAESIQLYTIQRDVVLLRFCRQLSKLGMWYEWNGMRVYNGADAGAGDQWLIIMVLCY